MEKTVIELFAGVGGFRVGLNNIKSFDESTGRAIENQSWKFVWANQWEPSTKVQPAYNCYVTRFGASEVANEDISKIIKSTIPDHSLLVGGFPCQDYSVARSKSTEQGIKGIKGVLFWEIVETLKEKKTPFFLLENVDRLLKSPAAQRGRDFGIMLRTLSDLGYNVEWRVINAAEYGRGQRRRRVFIYGWRSGKTYDKSISRNSPKNLIQESGLFATDFPIEPLSNIIKTINILELSDTVEMTEKFSFLFENTGIMINGIVTTTKTTPIYENPIPLRKNLEKGKDMSSHLIPEDRIEKFRKLRRGKKVPRVKPNGEKYFYSEGSMSDEDSLDLPARTMLTSERSTNRSTHILIDPNLGKLRYLSPIEAERLQDFPDNWTNTGMTQNQRFFMMGNALVTGIINRLDETLSIIIENEN